MENHWHIGCHTPGCFGDMVCGACNCSPFQYMNKGAISSPYESTFVVKDVTGFNIDHALSKKNGKPTVSMEIPPPKEFAWEFPYGLTFKEKWDFIRLETCTPALMMAMVRMAEGESEAAIALYRDFTKELTGETIPHIVAATTVTKVYDFIEYAI